MSRNYTRSDIRTRSRMLANLRSTSFPTDGEANDLINVHYCEVYDLLVQAGPPEYYASRTTITTVSGTIAYALPSDFRSMLMLYSNESTDERRPILGIDGMERAVYKAPSGVYELTLEYIPAPAIITSDATNIDGVSGWEELIVAFTARDMLLMEGSPIPGNIEKKIESLTQRIRTASCNRDKGQSRKVRDTSIAYQWNPLMGVGIYAYRLFGGNIELFEPTVWAT